MKIVKIITFMALFTALSIVLRTYSTFFLFGSTKFGLSFIPEVIGSAVLGPVLGAVVGGVSDFLGFFIKMDGKYFPGFTVSAIIKCAIYGLFLFKKPKSLKNIIFAILSSMVLVDLGVNSLWINKIYGTKISVVFLSKVATLPLYALFQITLVFTMLKRLDKEIAKILE